jgi:hypothetical protein
MGIAAGGLIGGLGGGILGSMVGTGIGNMFGAEVRHGGGISGMGSRTYRNVSSNIFSGAPKFHGGLMPDEIPSILQRGEAVLTRSQVGGLAQMMQTHQALGSNLPSPDEFGMMNSAASAYTRATATSTASPQGQQSMTKIESLLEQLITHTKEGKTLQIDGKKVGSTIMSAFSRE